MYLLGPYILDSKLLVSEMEGTMSTSSPPSRMLGQDNTQYTNVIQNVLCLLGIYFQNLTIHATGDRNIIWLQNNWLISLRVLFVASILFI